MHPIKKKDSYITPTYARQFADKSVPKYEMPKEGLSREAAYNLVKDELIMDGNSRLNLATFVTTWMEPEAKKLIDETLDKNMVDKDEYPATAEIELRCVNILARLYHAPEDEKPCGTSTIGSSEAAMLCGMAMKWRWRKRMEAKGKQTAKPNIVMGANVQVCWEKFCRYFEIEPRFVPCEKDRFHLDPQKALELCDENTIGVVGIMGSTFDGSYEPIEELNRLIDKYNSKSGFEIPIHVDAASGGFIAPFLQPKLKWDFRLKWVKSINVSGHKYGLVYPGVGWAIWRSWDEMPKELLFHVSYLGGNMPTLAINFSRPGEQVVAQYYNFLRLGFEGYRKIQQNCQDVALYLSSQIAKMGPFKLISDGSDIPVFCWTLKEKTNFSLYDLAERLRDRGWLVPAYPMPENAQDLVVQRVVVKEGFSHDMADKLLADIRRHLDYFANTPTHVAKTEGSHFHH